MLSQYNNKEYNSAQVIIDTKIGEYYIGSRMVRARHKWVKVISK